MDYEKTLLGICLRHARKLHVKHEVLKPIIKWIMSSTKSHAKPPTTCDASCWQMLTYPIVCGFPLWCAVLGHGWSQTLEYSHPWHENHDADCNFCCKELTILCFPKKHIQKMFIWCTPKFSCKPKLKDSSSLEQGMLGLLKSVTRETKLHNAIKVVTRFMS